MTRKKPINKSFWSDEDLLENTVEQLNRHRHCKDMFSDDIGSTKRRIPEGWKRATFILKTDIIEKLKACAYWDRVTLKNLLEEIILLYLDKKIIMDIPQKNQRSY